MHKNDRIAFPFVDIVHIPCGGCEIKRSERVFLFIQPFCVCHLLKLLIPYDISLCCHDREMIHNF